jgi:hypothetical protein
MSSTHRSIAARIVVLIAVLLLVAGVGAGWKWHKSGEPAAGWSWSEDGNSVFTDV